MPAKEARFYEELQEGLVRCTICPRRCVLKPGQRGFCGTRENRDGRLYSLIYGEVSASAVDPIEKKPLFHFEPGSLTFSISSVGCNFKCPWCQNYHLSWSRPQLEYSLYLEPAELAEIARRVGDEGICASFNEPGVAVEYV